MINRNREGRIELGSEWMYLVWVCECPDNMTVHRPAGKKMTQGCGHVNIRRSKVPLTRKANVQDKCRGFLPDGTKCGRGRRLNNGNTYIFFDEIEAMNKRIELQRWADSTWERSKIQEEEE
jgi:hypothetical protein